MLQNIHMYMNIKKVYHYNIYNTEVRTDTNTGNRQLLKLYHFFSLTYEVCLFFNQVAVFLIQILKRA